MTFGVGKLLPVILGSDCQRCLRQRDDDCMLEHTGYYACIVIVKIFLNFLMFFFVVVFVYLFIFHNLFILRVFFGLMHIIFYFYILKNYFELS